MKVAKLVTYSICIRIIVDSEDSEEEIIRVSRNKILSDPSSYVYGDNINEIENDTECPYDEEYDE